MSPAEAVDLVADAEAEGVTLVPSAEPGRIRAEWPDPEVADRYRFQVVRHRAAVLEVLTWPRCHRCTRHVPPGHALCSGHVEELTAEFRPDTPAAPRPTVAAVLEPSAEVVALAIEYARARGGRTVRRPDVAAAERDLGRALPVARPASVPGGPG